MPSDFDGKRARYYPPPDLAATYYFDRAIKVLTTSDEKDIQDVNDAIEVYQCKLIAEKYGCQLGGYDPEVLVKSAKKLFGAACNLVSGLIDRWGLVAVFDGVEILYCSAFWDFLATGNMWTNVSDDALTALVARFPTQLPSLLRYPQLVNQHEIFFVQAMQANIQTSAELVIGAFAASGKRGGQYFLPKCLSNCVLDSIMLDYLDGEEPNINLGHVRILANWPSSANTYYVPSPDVRVKARKRADALKREFVERPTASIRTELTVRYSSEQHACKKTLRSGISYERTFSVDWLQKYTDPPTILNNLIYVFDLVGIDGLMSSASHKRNGSTLLKSLGLHSKDEYPKTPEAEMEEWGAIGVIALYRKLLVEEGGRLEDAIEFFFNEYIEEEFGIEGFTICLPNEETALLDKCKSVGPEIERVLKAFKVYVEKGAVNSAYFPYITIKDFHDIPSLLENKYLIEGSEFETIAFCLMSDQSPLAYSPTHPQGVVGFYEMITQFQLTKRDFIDYCHPLIDNLLDKGFLVMADDGTLQPTGKSLLIALVWRRGAARTHFFANDSKDLEELVSDNIIQYCNYLLSPDESDYLSYLLNDAKFSDAMALRNKYNHGSAAVSDLTQNELESDYDLMLIALIGIVLKINEELSMMTGKGGLATCELVDWPLTEG